MRRVWPRQVAGLLVPLLAAGLFLSGCGGDSPEPEPLPKDSKSSKSASPSPTPPAMPAAAAKKTKAGAIAFVRHYVSVLNYATFSGQTNVARAMDGGRCSSCKRMLASIDAIYEKGGRVEGGAWKPSPVSDVAHPGGSGWTVDAKITYGPQVVYTQAGAEPKNFTGGGRLVSFILKGSQGGWKVSEWTRAS